MAEMLDWAEVTLACNRYSDRAPFVPGGGGALNANYTTVDAIAHVSTICGSMGLRYNEDFWFAHTGMDTITFYFKDEKYIMMLGLKS